MTHSFEHSDRFSLNLYLLIIIVLSWPFQIAYFFLGETYKPILLVSMIMVAVGAYISGKYVFKDGFADADFDYSGNTTLMQSTMEIQ